MAGSGDGLVNGCTECSVSSGVVEHVQIRRCGEKGILGIVESLFLWFVFLNDDPLGVSGERVDTELEGALSRLGAHGSGKPGCRVKG